VGVIWLLAKYWLPLGAGKSLMLNVVFVALLVGFILGLFSLLEYYYKSILKWCLDHKKTFLFIPSFLIETGSFAFSISYDVNLSGLSAVSNGQGGYELSIRYVSPNPFGTKKTSVRFF